jgi:hypothetical protein
VLVAAALIVPTLVATPAFADPSTSTVTADATAPRILPTSYPYQQQLDVFAQNPNDASIGRGALPYADIAPKLNEWAEQSDYISTQAVGKSANGWDLYLVTLTAPETAEETAQQDAWKHEIKYDSASAATDAALDAGYKRPIWFNGNIHGNEWEGTDASMNYIESVLESEDDLSVQTMLEKYRLYFTVSLNPDGRIIGQRPNGQNLDLNRDFVTNSSPETTMIRDLTAEIQPIFFIDLHGYTGVLQVEPCGPPHGENYDYDLFIPHAYAAALAIEQDVVDAAIPGNTYRDKVSGATSTTKTDTSGITIPYRDTPSGWDDWPPVFTAQYVAYQGAISYTVELPLPRVNNNPTQNAFNSAVDTEVAETVIESTLEYIGENDDDILDNQIEIFRRGDAGEPLRLIPAEPDAEDYTGPTEWIEEWGADDAQGHTETDGAVFPRSYVIPVGDAQRSDSDAATLVNFLITHGIQLKKTTEPLVVGDMTYPAGSYLVDMHQPLRGMANALLAPGHDISDWVPSMYDISAWSQGFLWGATVEPVGSTTDVALGVATMDIAAADATGSVPGGKSYLTFELDGVDDFRGLNSLLNDGIPASLVGTNTVVLGNSAESRAAASQVADEFGVAFTGTSGFELEGDDVKPLSRLRIGYTGNQDDTLSLGELGFESSQLTPVSAATLQSNAVSLADIDLLWLGSGLAPSAAQPVADQQLRDYVAAGKGVVGRGTGANTFANRYYDLGSTAVSGNGSGNGIVNLTTPEGSLLEALDVKYGFVYPAVSFALGAGHGKVEQSYATTDTLISGHWRSTTATNGPEFAAGRASVVSSTLDSGAKAVVFGTSVVFRTHTKGHFSELATAMLAAAQPSTGATVALPDAATSTSVTLPSSEIVYGSSAAATVSITSATELAPLAGTVELRVDGATVATAPAAASVSLAMPSDLTVGAHTVSAVYVAAEDGPVSSSTSADVPFTVTAVGSVVTVTATSTTYGTASTVSVGVSRAGAAAAGTVALTVDGEPFGTASLVAGSAQVALPKKLDAGTHTVAATFMGDATTGASTGSAVVTVSKAHTTTNAKVKTKRVIAQKTKVKLAVSVKAPDATRVIPGELKVFVNGKATSFVTLKASAKGQVTFKMPKFTSDGVKRIRVKYLGSDNLKASTSSVLKVKVRG